MFFASVRGLTWHKINWCQFSKIKSPMNNEEALLNCPGCSYSSLRKYVLKKHILKCKAAIDGGYLTEMGKMLEIRPYSKQKLKQKSKLQSKEGVE